jgi:carboxypeptidase Q
VTATGIRSARLANRPRPLPEIILAVEHYNRIVRIVHEYREPAAMEVEVRTQFYDKDTRGYNVVAEIPGTDKKDEIVLLGGHIDSWSPGTGAADNAAGVAVSMEAVRILKALGVRPRRTIRVVLWSAEEKGWLGSRAYVQQHFGDVETMTLKPEHARVSAYFNYDNGTGRIRGINLQQNIEVGPIFAEWMKPLADLGMTQVATRSTGGSDHGALDYIGIPAFQWIQDPIDYGTRIHHTNLDVFDHLEAEDLIQSAVVTASFVYHTAMREEMLPRKPLPPPFKYPVRR